MRSPAVPAGAGPPAAGALLLEPDPATGSTLLRTTSPRGVLLERGDVAQLVRAAGYVLRVLAGHDAPASGEVSARPPDGQPPAAYGAVPIMDAVLHDVWCGWAWQLADPRRPDLAFCSGCSLYVREPAEARISR